VEYSPTHLELGIRRRFESDRRGLAVGAARMRADEAGSHVIAQHETRVAHAERLEDVLLKIGFQRLSAHRLDHLAGKIDADAVFPIRAGIDVILAGQDAGQPCDLHVASEISVEDVVAVAGRMREQVAERDRRLGIAQLRRAVGIETLEHLHVPNDGQHVAHRLVEADASLFDELHGRGAGDRFGHRGDAEDGIWRHRFGLVDRPDPEGSFVEDAAIVGRQRHDAGNEAGFDRFVEDQVELEQDARLP
jgi:hypothetical protein